MKKLLFVLTSLLFLTSCGLPLQYNRDISFIPASKLRLQVPEGTEKKAETSFMVAFVAPEFEAKMLTNPSPSISNFSNYRKMDNAKQAYFEVIKKSLLTDLEHILLQKNIRVLGPFKSWDEMTFDDRKRAIYIFEPIILIDVTTPHTKGERQMGYKEEGEIVVTGSIIFTLRESITREKVWIKRLEAEEIKKPYRFVAKFKEPKGVAPAIEVAFLEGVEEYDNTDSVLNEALSEFYASLGAKIWKQIDPEEWEKYLGQATGLRKEKRY